MWIAMLQKNFGIVLVPLSNVQPLANYVHDVVDGLNCLRARLNVNSGESVTAGSE